MSVKGAILVSLQTVLSGITKDNGYSLDVRKVCLGAQSMSQATELCPSIVIVEGNEIKIAENATNVMFAAELSITGILKSFLTGNTLTEDINSFAAGIKTLLYSSPPLGANNLAIRILGIDNGTAENFDHAFSSVVVQLIYYAPKASF